MAGKKITKAALRKVLKRHTNGKGKDARVNAVNTAFDLKEAQRR